VKNITAPKIFKTKTFRIMNESKLALPGKTEKSRKPRKRVIKPEHKDTTPRAKNRPFRDLRSPEIFRTKQRLRFLLYITAFALEPELSLNLHRFIDMQTPHHLCINKTHRNKIKTIFQSDPSHSDPIRDSSQSFDLPLRMTLWKTASEVKECAMSEEDQESQKQKPKILT